MKEVRFLVVLALIFGVFAGCAGGTEEVEVPADDGMEEAGDMMDEGMEGDGMMMDDADSTMMHEDADSTMMHDEDADMSDEAHEEADADHESST